VENDIAGGLINGHLNLVSGARVNATFLQRLADKVSDPRQIINRCLRER